MSYIGIAGQAQHGKDSLADYLHVKLNDRLAKRNPESPVTPWTRSAFARAVKDIFCTTFGKDLAYVEQWKVSPQPPPDLDITVRKALQFIGDGFRQIKGSIWIDIMFRDKDAHKIISDVRYVNELQALHDHGGFNILVVHPDRINDDPNGSEAQMRPFADYALWRTGGGHSDVRSMNSPVGWPLVNSVIINDGTLVDLYRKADDLIPRIERFFAAKERAA
jgi:hypothetical protein